MAKDNAQACRDSRLKAAAARERLGIVNRKWPVARGIDEKLTAPCTTHDFEDWRELLDTVIQRLHEATQEDAERFLAVSQHQFTPSQKMLRQIDDYAPLPEPE